MINAEYTFLLLIPMLLSVSLYFTTMLTIPIAACPLQSH